MSSYLKTRIMRRVYAIYVLRKMLSPRSLKVAIILASLWQIHTHVAEKFVLANMPRVADIVAVAKFYLAAFLHTQSIVQVSILASGVLVLWLAKDVLRPQVSYWF